MASKCFALFVISCLFGILAGCGGGSGSTPAPPTIVSVAVACSPSSILTTQTSTCTATVTGTGGYSSAVSWSVSPSTAGTITSGGVLTPSGAGTATITATSTQDASKSGSSTVTVAVPASITSVAVACLPSSILTTQTSTCTATVSGAGSYSSAVTWSVSPSTAGTVSSAGVFTPSGAGTATITATSTQDSTKSGSSTITVSVPVTITSVSVACSPSSITTVQTSTCTPTVNGTGSYSSAVTWSISPASIGTINGAGLFRPATTGTATITATSSQDSTKSGATTVSVQIAPPSGLAYSTSPLSAIAGQEIMPDVPVLTGTATSFSVSPALPAGLSLDTTTGTISGTPTAATAQSTYTVTAVGAGASTTANITITVKQAQNILLELGHANYIQAIQFVGSRILSIDSAGHWVLWNYTSGAQVASGDIALASNSFYNSVAIAGQTILVEIPNGLQVRALADGHLITTINFPGLNMNLGVTQPWWQLASDGSYICVGSQSGLFVYSSSGQLAVSLPGDFSKAKAFAAPGQIQVALGPAGQNVVQTISPVNGASAVSAPFSGSFNSWFLDGGRFITNLGTTVWVYSNTGVQQALVSLPTVEFLKGQGNWICTWQSAGSGSPLAIYAIGSETPSLSLNVASSTQPFITGTRIGAFSSATQFSVVDLSSTTLSSTSYNLPFASTGAIAFQSTSVWMAGSGDGELFDGASGPGAPRYFGFGNALGLAGSSNTAAISTAIGKVLVFNPSPAALQQTINFSGGKLALSSDGSVLGAFNKAGNNQTLNFYSLPSSSVISSYSYSFSGTTPVLSDFSLALSGTVIGQITYTGNNATRQVTGITGAPSIWSDTGSYGDPIRLSPDGTLIAVTQAYDSIQGYVTKIFLNGSLVTAVPGAAAGWIDNNRVLVNQFAIPKAGLAPPYTGSTIYSSAGAALATPSLPQLDNIQTVTSNSVYDAKSNAIYSLTSGQSTWTGTYPSSALGAVVGSNVVYQSGHSVVVEPF